MANGTHVSHTYIPPCTQWQDLSEDDRLSLGIIETANALIILLDAEGRILFFNQHAEKLTGYSRDEVIGESWLKLFLHSTDRPALHQGLTAIASGKTSFWATENPILTKEQNTCYIHWHAAPFVLPDGQVAILGTGIDRTVEKEQAERLRITNRRLQQEKAMQDQMLQAAPRGLILTDAKGKITFANQAAEEIVGLKRSKEPGTLFDQPEWHVLTVDGKPFPANEDPFALGCRAKKQHYNLDCAVEKPTGRRLLELWLTPIRNDAGQVTRFLAAFNDVTDGRLADKILQVQRRIDKRILREESFDAVLGAICEEISALLDNAATIVLLKNEDFQSEIRASAGVSQHVLDSLSVRWNSSSSGRGPGARAIRTGSTHTGRVAPHMGEEWADLADRLGFSSYLSLPLQTQAKTIGALTIYSRRRIFEPPLISSLTTFAHQASMSLMAAYQQEQIRLRSSALEAAANAIVITKRNGTVEWANQAYERLTGFSLSEVVGKPLPVWSSPEQDDRLYQDMWEKLISGQVWQGELINHRKDGTSYIEEQTITPVHNEAGEVTHFVAVKTDVTRRKAQEERLRRLALQDTLTKLANREGLGDHLNEAVAQAEAGERSALVLVDIDDFTLLRSTLGHTGSDQLLLHVAEILKQKSPFKGPVARIDGDEFAVLLPNASIATARTFAQDLQKRAGERFVYGKKTVHPTLSVGIAAIDGTLSPEKVMTLAEAALFVAQKKGSNRVVAFSSLDERGASLDAIHRWTLRIKQALQEERLALQFQPIVRTADGSPVHYEALVRLLNKNGRLVLPGRFVAIAERLNLMPQIDLWVVSQVLKILSAHPELKVFVNLSGASLNDEDMLETITGLVRQAGEAGRRLSFEITETAAIANVYRSERWLRHLKDLGCGLALDDFGVGFTSFNYLRSLPIDYLKIDGSFVQSLPQDSTNRAIMAAITNVAHAVGKKVIAEWVETKPALDVITALGIELGQGFLWSRPKNLDELLKP